MSTLIRIYLAHIAKCMASPIASKRRLLWQKHIVTMGRPILKRQLTLRKFQIWPRVMRPPILGRHRNRSSATLSTIIRSCRSNNKLNNRRCNPNITCRCNRNINRRRNPSIHRRCSQRSRTRPITQTLRIAAINPMATILIARVTILFQYNMQRLI